MRRFDSTPALRRLVHPGILVVAAGTLLISACDRDSLMAPPIETPTPARMLGLVEVTISGLPGQEVASAISAPDVATLARMRGQSIGGDVALFETTRPENLDDSGDGTIQLQPVATGSFTDGARGTDGVRYIYATFRVRNAQTDGTAYDSPRQNLTFLAAAHASTLEETAISSLLRFDGSPAAAGVATTMVPTGSVRRAAGDAGIEPHTAGILQVLTEAEAAEVLAFAPAGVTTVFPYGFVVDNPSTPGSRSLPENPAVDQFDGLVTFAFKVPLQATAAGDPYTITASFLAVDDTETRVTESLEEQGTTSAQTAANALGTAGVTLLGNSSTAISGHGTRRVCVVRTAGTDPNNPAATLVDAGPGCSTGAVALPVSVRVVDAAAAPGGDGTTWTGAFQYLQDAMACARDEAGVGGACEGVSEIWVAAGHYFPDDGGGQADNSIAARFTLIEGVSLYGGFAGGEYSRDQRDWTANPTVLDGDVDGNGTLGGNATGLLNTDPVETITRATVVDGFTLQAVAAAASSNPFRCFADLTGECSPTLRNLRFANLTTVEAAVAVVARDGGTAAPLFENVEFIDNATTSVGSGAGAVYIAATNGSRAAPVFVNTLFSGNSGSIAGSILVFGSFGEVDVDVTNSVFRDNTASGADAGIIHIDASAVAVEGTSLSFSLIGSELWDNTAAGGAIINAMDSASVDVVGSTIAGNTGAATVRMLNSGSLSIANSIIYGNSNPPVTLPMGLDLGIARNSILEGGCDAALTTCVAVFDTNPQFVDLANGDLRLGGVSLAVNAGDNSMVPVDVHDVDGDGDTAEPLPLDVAGRTRIFDWGGGSPATPIVDMGAHERQ